MTNLIEAITHLSDLVEKVMAETINQSDFSDLSQQQLHYLLVIYRMHNPSISQLASELQLTKPTVTVLVDKLEQKGYLKRVQSDNDRRRLHLHIDTKGSKITSLRELAHTRMADAIRSELNETETVILTELLKKIIQHE